MQNYTGRLQPSSYLQVGQSFSNEQPLKCPLLETE
jgi:hypothetical protein